MQGQIHTELGSILIDADVVATYAGSVALGCSGIVGMASLDMRDGLMKLLKKDSLSHPAESFPAFGSASVPAHGSGHQASHGRNDLPVP